MKLKEYLDREPSGMAFVDVVEWLKATYVLNKKISPAELAARQREAILRYGGIAVSIRVKGVIMDDVSV